MFILDTDLIKLNLKIVGKLLSIDFDVYSDHTFPCNMRMFMAKSNVVP